MIFPLLSQCLMLTSLSWSPLPLYPHLSPWNGRFQYQPSIYLSIHLSIYLYNYNIYIYIHTIVIDIHVGVCIISISIYAYTIIQLYTMYNIYIYWIHISISYTYVYIYILLYIYIYYTNIYACWVAHFYWPMTTSLGEAAADVSPFATPQDQVLLVPSGEKPTPGNG